MGLRKNAKNIKPNMRKSQLMKGTRRRVITPVECQHFVTLVMGNLISASHVSVKITYLQEIIQIFFFIIYHSMTKRDEMSANVSQESKL